MDQEKSQWVYHGATFRSTHIKRKKKITCLKPCFIKAMYNSMTGFLSVRQPTRRVMVRPCAKNTVTRKNKTNTEDQRLVDKIKSAAS